MARGIGAAPDADRICGVGPAIEALQVPIAARGGCGMIGHRLERPGVPVRKG